MPQALTITQAQALPQLERQVGIARRAALRGDSNTDAYAHYVINAILDGLDV